MNLDFLKNKYGMQLLLFLMISFLSYIIFGLLSTTFIAYYYEIDIENLTNEINSPNNISLTYILLISHQIGFFLLPPLVFAGLMTSNKMKYLNINFKVDNRFWYSILVFSLTAIPIMGYTAYVNGLISLPDFFGNMEDKAIETTGLILSNKGIPNLLLNILVLGLLPAIGEELFFRGTIQKLLAGSTKNKHLAVLATGFLFSFIHFQFYTFLPRFFIGVMLGYLLIWSRSIIIPIIAHFLNNLIGILAFYYISDEVNGSNDIDWIILIPSILIFFSLCYWYQKNTFKHL